MKLVLLMAGCDALSMASQIIFQISDLFGDVDDKFTIGSWESTLALSVFYFFVSSMAFHTAVVTYVFTVALDPIYFLEAFFKKKRVVSLTVFACFGLPFALCLAAYLSNSIQYSSAIYSPTIAGDAEYIVSGFVGLSFLWVCFVIAFTFKKLKLTLASSEAQSQSMIALIGFVVVYYTSIIAGALFAVCFRSSFWKTCVDLTANSMMNLIGVSNYFVWRRYLGKSGQSEEVRTLTNSNSHSLASLSCWESGTDTESAFRLSSSASEVSRGAAVLSIDRSSTSTVSSV
jgi:hypothetical protein